MPARPPSEQSVEYQLLDKIAELTERLSQQTIPPSPNWWDVLPEGSEILAGNYTQEFALYPYASNSPPIRLIAARFPDRIELSLRTYNGDIWKRALFFKRLMSNG
jgi:hypothetical protein